MMLSKSASKLIFFNEKKMSKICIIFDVETLKVKI